MHNIYINYRKALKKLDFDIVQFAVDIHSFFKLSSARRETYATMEEVINLRGYQPKSFL